MSDGSHIMILFMYLFAKHARFLIDHGLIYVALSPLFKGYSKSEKRIKYYYPNDEFGPDMIPTDLDTKKNYARWKGVGSIPRSEVYNAFYNPETRRFLKITNEGADYFMSLVEDINTRKDLLIKNGIISNPYFIN